MAMDTAVEPPAVQCNNPECRVAIDGRCIEGLDFSVCSHYGKALVILEGPRPEIGKVIPPRIRLPGAEALVATAAQLVIHHHPCNVIAIVGPHASGKTSLISGVYDLLQHGVVGDFSFAGSSTLHAFERACHDSRAASKREEPHMERTQTGDATYFHIDLVQHGCADKRAALFANRAGEDYIDTQSDPSLAKEFAELPRCDTLTVLADGKKLLDVGERHQVREDICQTLRAFEEAGQTRRWQQLALVLTKIDEVQEDKANGERALHHFLSIVEDVRSQFTANFMDISVFQVAASPKTDGAERGVGMVELLTYWMGTPGRLKHGEASVVVAPGTRAFDRLRKTISGVVDA
jgi:hypothetical protein